MRPAALDSTLTIDQVNAALVDRDGTIWGVTRSGRVLRRPHGGRLREVAGSIVSFSGSSLAVDALGDVWIAAGDQAVYRVHNDTLERVAFPPGLVVDDPNRAYATSDSSVWFGTRTALIQLRHGRFRRVPLPARDGLSALSSILEAADGKLWIGTHGAGLYVFDGERFTAFTRRDGLSDDRVIEILRDRSGNMWVATRDGLNRFRPVPFDVFTSATGLPTEMPGAMVGEPSGTIWLAPPTGGLYRGGIAGRRASIVEAEPVRNYDRVTVLVPARAGGVWAGRLLGSVSRFTANGPPGAHVAENLPPVTELLEDADGTLWIGTWRGLFRRQGGRQERLTDDHGLPDAFIHRMLRTSDGARGPRR
jgi:ligand-binding sensor domain-containing protein